MAETEITKTVGSLAGISVNYQAANIDGNYWECLANYIYALVVFNNNNDSDAEDVIVTILDAQGCNQGFDHDRTKVVPPNGNYVIWTPFRYGDEYNDDDNKIHFIYNQVDTVQVAVIEVPLMYP